MKKMYQFIINSKQLMLQWHTSYLSEKIKLLWTQKQLKNSGKKYFATE